MAEGGAPPFQRAPGGPAVASFRVDFAPACVLAAVVPESSTGKTAHPRGPLLRQKIAAVRRPHPPKAVAELSFGNHATGGWQPRCTSRAPLPLHPTVEVKPSPHRTPGLASHGQHSREGGTSTGTCNCTKI